MVINVRPFWKIIPLGQEGDSVAVESEEGKLSILHKSGAGWGTGAHETTQLCLQAIAFMYPRKNAEWRMLDFGSGSGLLSIAAAKLGGIVDAIEIDEEGILNGNVNAHLNGLDNRIRASRWLDESHDRYDLVVANILRPILLEFASELTDRLGDNGTLILSGLVATDIPEVSTRFVHYLKGRLPLVYQKGEWRALIWSQTTPFASSH